MTQTNVSQEKTNRYFDEKPIGEVFAEGKQQPKRKRIFGDFLYQDTNTLFYSNRNYGKTVLSFQIAVCAATGTSFDNANCFQNECDPMQVLYFDFEMDAQTFYERHSKIYGIYDKQILNDNLYVLHDKQEQNAVYGLALLEKIEEVAIRRKSKLIILDNITRLLPDLLKADKITKFIAMLRRIKQTTGASFLVIGHTSKNLPTVAITENSYYGSAHIANFFTEMFYLDKVKDTLHNYFLRHAKSKNKTQWIETVPTLEISDKHINHGLGFTFLSVQQLTSVQMPLFTAINTKAIKASDYKDLIKSAYKGGMSQTDIATLFKCTKQAINKLIN